MSTQVQFISFQTLLQLVTLISRSGPLRSLVTRLRSVNWSKLGTRIQNMNTSKHLLPFDSFISFSLSRLLDVTMFYSKIKLGLFLFVTTNLVLYKICRVNSPVMQKNLLAPPPNLKCIHCIFEFSPPFYRKGPMTYEDANAKCWHLWSNIIC